MPAARDEVIVSADSHVFEDPHLWEKHLPTKFHAVAPLFPEREVGGQFQAHSGGFDPTVRVDEMAKDGVSQEILYPSLAMNLFGLTDVDLQEACFSVYSDYIAEYCSAAPDRLFAIAPISTYRIDHAVKALEQYKAAGIKGAMVWQVPPGDLSFATDHYEPLWEAAQDLEMVINLHILTGEPYPWPRERPKVRPLITYAHTANKLIFEASNAVADLIVSGVLERYPTLKFVLVENEASWIPFFLSRYDSFMTGRGAGSTLSMLPSEYFLRQFFATFFDDPMLAPILNKWGVENCMWSNDFPHPNSTWPHSREVIERDLGHLTAVQRDRLVRGNVQDLYKLPSVMAVSR